MDFILHGYCGLYCGACPIVSNTKIGRGTEQCYGCKSEQPTGYCAVRGIKACARGKGHEFCNECSEINSCEQMQKFVEDTKWLYQQGVLKNMAAIRRDGLAKWLEGQEKRWRCTTAARFILGGMKPVHSAVKRLRILRRMYYRYFAKEIDSNNKDCFYSLQIFSDTRKSLLPCGCFWK